MMCSHGENCLLDGHSPYIDTSLVNWASNLVTVRKNDATDDIYFEHVVLTFSFEKCVKMAVVEVDFFLCPQWGIHAPYLTLYCSDTSEVIVYPPGSNHQTQTNTDFISNYEPTVCGCQSLSTVRIPVQRGEPAHPFWHIVVSFPPPYQDIEWVHVEEVRLVLKSRKAHDDDGDDDEQPTTSCRLTKPVHPIQTDSVLLTTNVPNTTVHLMTNVPISTKQIPTNITNLFTKTNVLNPTVQMSINPSVPGKLSSNDISLPDSTNNETLPSISQTAVSTPSIYQSTIKSFTTAYSAFATTLLKSTKSVLVPTRPTSLISTNSKSSNPTHRLPFVTTAIVSPQISQSSKPGITTAIPSTAVPQSSEPAITTAILPTAVPQSSEPGITTAIPSTAVPQSSEPGVTTAILPTVVPQSSEPGITAAILPTAVPQSSEPGITTAIPSTAVPQSSEPGITTAILPTAVPQSSEPGITAAIPSTAVPQSSEPGITTAILPTAVPQSSEPGITTAILPTAVPQSSEPGITTAILPTAVPQSSEPGITTAILPTAVPQSSEPGITTAILPTVVPQSSEPGITTAILPTANDNGVPPTNSKLENHTPHFTSHTTLIPPGVGFPDIDGIDNEQTRKNDNDLSLLLIVAIAVLIGLCLLVLVALLIMRARLRQRKCVKLQKTVPNNGPQVTVYNPLYVSPSVIAESTFNDSINHSDFAGEHGFGINNVVNDAPLLQLPPIIPAVTTRLKCLLEITGDNMNEFQDISNGAFGKVVLAHTKGLCLQDIKLTATGDSDQDAPVLVVAKMLKSCPTQNEREAFDKEINFMSQFEHPNVLRLLGVCYNSPAFIMLEYPEDGDLNQFLQKFSEIVPIDTPFSSNQITTSTLIYMASQIASAMQFLATFDYIHRDISTRKCLVGKNFNVKLADLGVNISSYLSHYYCIHGNRLVPIRWLAIECFEGKFSEKSDVWAFGVTMWELFTLAKEVPYPHLSDEELIYNVLQAENYQAPSRPTACPHSVYQIMEQCWIINLQLRASFQEVNEMFKTV